MANILQMLSKESIVEMKKKTSRWILRFWFFQLHSFLQMLLKKNNKKNFVTMKKETNIQVKIFINDFTSYTQNYKKKL